MSTLSTTELGDQLDCLNITPTYCLTYADTVKRTILVAKAVPRQIDAKKSSKHSNLFSCAFQIGSKAHQLDSFELPSTTSKPETTTPSENNITKTNCCNNFSSTINCDVTNKNKTKKCFIPLPVAEPPRTPGRDDSEPQNPNKRMRISDEDRQAAGPSNDFNMIPIDIPSRPVRVPSQARFDEEPAGPRGVAPNIPDIAMPLYRTLRNAENKKAKAEIVIEYQMKYHDVKLTPKTLLLDVPPPFGRDDPDLMSSWYSIIATAEHSFNGILCENVIITEARATLAQCLTTDAQITEANRAINSVNDKVRRKEKLSREDKLVKDRLANRERANKRRGIPNPVNTGIRPSDKPFRQRGNPKQGRNPNQNQNQVQANQRQAPREARPNPGGQRRPQGRERNERMPRPRGQARAPAQTQNQARSQVRNSPNLRPDQTSQIERFMMEIKKLMRK